MQHCCWPSQDYDTSREMCVGTATCLDEYEWREDESACISLVVLAKRAEDARLAEEARQAAAEEERRRQQEINDELTRKAQVLLAAAQQTYAQNLRRGVETLNGDYYDQMRSYVTKYQDASVYHAGRSRRVPVPEVATVQGAMRQIEQNRAKAAADALRQKKIVAGTVRGVSWGLAASGSIPLIVGTQRRADLRRDVEGGEVDKLTDDVRSSVNTPIIAGYTMIGVGLIGARVGRAMKPTFAVGPAGMGVPWTVGMQGVW
jgi:hypothetical protein